MQADLGIDFDHTHAITVFIFFFIISSIVQLFIISFNINFLFFRYFFFIGWGREGRSSKDPCNDGALFIIHENEGYVVFFLSTFFFEKIVPVQAIRISISVISLSLSTRTLFRILQVNRDYRKWQYFQAFFLLLLNKQIRIFYFINFKKEWKPKWKLCISA